MGPWLIEAFSKRVVCESNSPIFPVSGKSLQLIANGPLGSIANGYKYLIEMIESLGFPTRPEKRKFHEII
jgi:hypothetical protein